MSATIFSLPHKTRPTGLLARFWAEIRTNVRKAERVVASRRNLNRLDDRMLSDIGISHAQAEYEAERRPWELLR
jgi:uncharacterized protein YjiS (DUF1127 family)